MSRRLFRLIGILMILGGIAVVAIPVYGIYSRSHNDSQALSQWNSGGSNDLVGAVPGATKAPSPTGSVCNAQTSPASDYALVSFPTLAGQNYAAVATNGTWDDLKQTSMVHYTTTPAPGEKGNVIIAFHREPNFEHIDQLNPGAIVKVQDRNCHTFSYKITQKWEISPNSVTQLSPTNGNDITLITCTPWWQDYNRFVWRGTLLPAGA